MATRQTFVSYKYFRDSAGINYAVLNSHNSDKIGSVKVGDDSNLVILTERVEIKLDGTQEIVIEYKGFGNLDILFDSTLQTQVYIKEVEADQSLKQDFDSLVRSFVFGINEDSDLGYTFSDSLFYAEGSQYRDLFIFPTSSNRHLNVSNSEEFYYTADGVAAYLASSELQNDFLNQIEHTNVGSSSLDIGKPRGVDKGTELNFSCTSSIDENITPPRVFGGFVVVSLAVRTSLVNRACLDPRGTNYYLKQCVDQKLPCVQSGVPINDCDGVALTAKRLNEHPTVDGGCCTFTTQCDEYNVVLKSTTKADSAVDNGGTATFEVFGGAANYKTVVNVNPLVGLDSTDVSYSTATTTGISTAEITVTGLFPGGYTITVSDQSEGSDACSQTLSFVISSEGATFDGLYGCKSTSSAINYDTGVTNHIASGCVFCNEGGKLQADVDNNGPILGPWVLDTGNSTIVNTGSDPDGTSLSIGKINFAGILYPDVYTVLARPNLLEFKVFEEFVSSQSDPVDYNLRQMNESGKIGIDLVNSAKQMALDNLDGKTRITDNSVSRASAHSIGTPHIFPGLAAGVYAILVFWDSDGTVNDSPEEEKCYEIFGPFIVEQTGCTDTRANNFNSDATIDDGSCTFPDNLRGCTDPTAINYNVKAIFDDGSCQFEKGRENIIGCTDPSADNYNPAATIDDGSCIFPSQGSYKCIKGICTFIENDFTGSKTLQECSSKGCSGKETDETRLRDFSANKFTISTTNSSSKTQS